MKLSFVVAVSDNGVIGVNNQLPWHLPNDLKFFKKNTLGKPIIMGRKTFLSLGKSLPGRMNIVLSKSLHEAPEGTQLFQSMEEAVKFLTLEGKQEACIIGGGQIFNTYRQLADEILITRVHTQIESGMTFFELPDEKEWDLIWSEHHSKDEKHAFAYTFQKWQRKN